MSRLYSLLINGIFWTFLLISCGPGSDGQIQYGEFGSEFSKEQVESLFWIHCAKCHMDNGASRSPGLLHLGSMTPRSIFASMETGKMQVQGAPLNRQEKIAIAELLTNREYTETKQVINRCDDNDIVLSQLKYFGWGGNHEGTGFVPQDIAGLNAKAVSSLELKWAFAFEGGTVTRTKPTVIDNNIFFGSQYGEVYCLDMFSGCVRWVFNADANVRGGLAVSRDIGDSFQIYFADFGGNTYALDAETGGLVWKASVKNEPGNAVTGSVIYWDSIVYVPLSSMEVVTAQQDSYECCKGSGQVVAIDALSGEEVWRHRVIGETASQRGINSAGAKRFGPSGAPVWCSPTIDKVRGLLYIGTGENNSNPPTLTSDAIQALDLQTGEVRWTFQATPKDAYIDGCSDGTGANCPDPLGPDVDFGMAPLLVTRPDGSEVLVVGQKSGVVHCLDPETGVPVWQKRIGRGGALGGIHWGMATDGKIVYAANSDWLPNGGDTIHPANPGLFALDIMSGEVLWKSTSDPKICRGKTGCYNANSAAPTMIPGVVFAGSLDGHARAYDAENGNVIWDFDTNRRFKTVNGIEGKGGSIDGPGPVIANGMVFFNSGYALFGQMPGNVLLAFALPD